MKKLLLGLLAIILLMFITWYSGVDIFDRGGEQAFMFFVGVVIGVVIQFFQSEKQ